MSQLNFIHRHVQLSQKVHRVQSDFLAKMDGKRTRISSEPLPEGRRPISQAVRLGFFCGASVVMAQVIHKEGLTDAKIALPLCGAFGSSAMYLGGASALLAAAPFLATVALAFSIELVGVGRHHCPGDPMRLRLSLSQHGVLGIPRALAEHAYLKAIRADAPNAARACLVGAIILSLPIELLRAAVFVIVTLVALPVALCVGGANALTSGAKCLSKAANIRPADYTAFVDVDLVDRQVVAINYAREGISAQSLSQRMGPLVGPIINLSVCRVRPTFFMDMLEYALKTPANDKGRLHADNALIARPGANIQANGEQAPHETFGDDFQASIELGRIRVKELTQALQRLKDGQCLPDDLYRFEPLQEALAAVKERPWCTEIDKMADAQHQIMLEKLVDAKYDPATKKCALEFFKFLHELHTMRLFLIANFNVGHATAPAPHVGLVGPSTGVKPPNSGKLEASPAV